MTSTLGGTALVTFGSDEAIEAVLFRIADSEQEFPVWGALSVDDAAMFRRATREISVATLDPERDLPTFRAGPFRLEQEDAARVFEALCDYATGESSCEPDSGIHAAAWAFPMPDVPCDCHLRDRAWSWASDIAGTFLVEMV